MTTNVSADRSPLITIVVPAWNAEGTIERALRSVLSQTDDRWALVVVDDGSTDATSEIVMRVSAADPRIRLLSQHNFGVAAARNRGVELVRGPYVAFLDSDDELAPTFLECMSAFVQQNPGYDVYHPNLEQESAAGERSLFLDETSVRERTFEELLDRCVIAAGGAVVSVASLLKAGGFAEDLHCEDYDLWLRMTCSGARVLYCPEALYTYHQASGERRSTDTASGIHDTIASLKRLLSAGSLHPRQVLCVERAIDRKSEDRARALMHDDLQAQADAFSNRIESVFGAKLGPVVLSFAHTISWMVRPVRKWLLVRDEKKNLLRDKM